MMTDNEEPKNTNESSRQPEDEKILSPFQQAETQEEEAAESAEPEAGELDNEELKRIIEALLFSSASPLSAARLASLMGVRSPARIRKLCEELKLEYESSRRAFSLEEIAGGYQLLTLPDFNTWVSKLREREHEESLSQSALETLAIIAYRQPITRAEIEDIRGVQSGYILRSLIEKDLVAVVGRSEELGHPLLYGTTKTFLEIFGLASLKALPKLEELEAKSGE
jgi:segregation and condensation protein B